MDSMRTLNSSLPKTSPPKQQTQDPPEQLLDAFKAAALSVTNLYKRAASDQTKTRAAGYQDALDDLLAFLDKENIGLNDGEGWSIRQWATSRLDGRDPLAQNIESDDEIEKPERGSSPILQRKPSITQIPQLPTRTSSPARQPEPSIPEVISEEPVLPPVGNFTFRSTIHYPADAEMTDDEQHREPPLGATIIPANSPSITVTRASRSTARQTQRTRHSTRASTTRTAGQKRKIDLGEFFDLGNLGQGKDGFGGSGNKRGRFA
jgi:hypothetical protein